MRLLFLSLGGLSVVAAIGAYQWAQTPVHEVGAFILLLASVILFSTAIIVGVLERLVAKIPGSRPDSGSTTS